MSFPTSQPFRSWSHNLPNRRTIRSENCLVGGFDGDGCGTAFIAVCLRILEALQQTGAGRFEIRRGGLIGSAAESSHGMALTPQTEDFCQDPFAAGGALLHGAGGGRFVYDLRRRFDLYCKISPLTHPPKSALN
jgi:3-isopropylmalate dehydrogenase